MRIYRLFWIFFLQMKESLIIGVLRVLHFLFLLFEWLSSLFSKAFYIIDNILLICMDIFSVWPTIYFTNSSVRFSCWAYYHWNWILPFYLSRSSLCKLESLRWSDSIFFLWNLNNLVTKQMTLRYINIS
jgi:hypothetical protein